MLLATTSTTACSDDRVTSVAAKGSLMGVSIAAGAVDQAGQKVMTRS